MMKSTRLVAFASLAFTLAACGGRSELNLALNGEVATDDGGNPINKSEGGMNDGTIILDGRTLDTSDGRLDSQRDSQVEVRRDTADTLPSKMDGLVKIDGPRDTQSDLRRDSGLTDGNRTLLGLEVSPTTARVAMGIPLPVLVDAIYSDGSRQDVTSSANYSSSDARIVRVTNGVITGIRAGSTAVTIRYSGLSTVLPVMVEATVLDSITIQGVGSLAIGQSIQLVAMGQFSDGSSQDVTAQAYWDSSSPTIARVVNGRVIGVDAGTARIRASIQAIMGSLEVTVSIKNLTSIVITPDQPTFQRGLSIAFKAIGTYDDSSSFDITKQAAWSSSDETILSVLTQGNDRGLATALAAGTVTLSASVNSVMGNTKVTVTAPTLTAIKISPSNPTIGVKENQGFQASGSYLDGTDADLTASVVWSSTNLGVAANILGKRGVFTGFAEGKTTIVAAFDGVKGSTELTVTGNAGTATKP